MDGKKEEGYLLGISPRNTTPPRATLAQLAEERLGSLQYLLQSKNGVTASPPSRNRPRASTATSTGGGTGRAAGRTAVRRSTSGNVEEVAADASVARSRGLFSSAPNVASRERWELVPRQQWRGSWLLFRVVQRVMGNQLVAGLGDPGMVGRVVWGE